MFIARRLPAALFVVALLTTCRSAAAIEQEFSTGVRHIPLSTQAISTDPGQTLTAVVVELAPGAKAPRHHHAGTVFAYVLDGTVRSQLGHGKAITYHTGQSWTEPPGSEHTWMENPSTTKPARLLATFVAPTGARLTTLSDESAHGAADER